ncbi:unnamed protein product [Symbiodinium microadriaticum]|nr:unnamed protein product [Symbiodinium microadriaticum]
MDDPRYGTESPESIPTLRFNKRTSARLLAGAMTSGEDEEVNGPFRTVQDVQMVDYNVFVAESVIHDCARLDASDASKRTITLTGGSSGLAAIIFSGKMLRQSIAWHGPFVMTTDEEIRDAIREYRGGTFLRQRADWDYKHIASKPAV